MRAARKHTNIHKPWEPVSTSYLILSYLNLFCGVLVQCCFLHHSAGKSLSMKQSMFILSTFSHWDLNSVLFGLWLRESDPWNYCAVFPRRLFILFTSEIEPLFVFLFLSHGDFQLWFPAGGSPLLSRLQFDPWIVILRNHVNGNLTLICSHLSIHNYSTFCCQI